MYNSPACLLLLPEKPQPHFPVSVDSIQDGRVNRTNSLPFRLVSSLTIGIDKSGEGESKEAEEKKRKKRGGTSLPAAEGGMMRAT